MQNRASTNEEQDMKEKNIERAIKSYLKTVDGLFFWKEHGGMYSTVGIPDLIICYKGKFIALEVKTPIGKATVMQVVQMQKIRKAGGLSKIVRSVNDVKEIIESIQ